MESRECCVPNNKSPNKSYLSTFNISPTRLHICRFAAGVERLEARAARWHHPARLLAREVPQFAQPRWPAVLVAVVRDEVTRTRAERRAVAEPSLRHGAGTQVDQALELQTFSRALDCRRPNLERAVHLNCTRGRCCLQRVGRLLPRRAARAREPVRRWRGAQHAAVLSRPRDALSLLLRLRCLLLPSAARRSLRAASRLANSIFSVALSGRFAWSLRFQWKAGWTRSVKSEA